MLSNFPGVTLGWDELWATESRYVVTVVLCGAKYKGWETSPYSRETRRVGDTSGALGKGCRPIKMPLSCFGKTTLSVEWPRTGAADFKGSLLTLEHRTDGRRRDKRPATGTLRHQETICDVLGLCFTYYVTSDVCWYFFLLKSSLLNHWSQYWRRSLGQPTQLSGGKIPQASGWLAHTQLNSNTESSVLQEISGTRVLFFFFLLLQIYLKRIKPFSTSLCYSKPTTNYIPIIIAPRRWIKRKFLNT